MKLGVVSALIAIFMCSSVAVKAQADLPDNVPASFQFGFKLPTTFANRSFRRLIDGVSDVHFNYQQPLFGNVMFGVGAKHQFLKVDDLKTPEITDGKLNIIHGFGKLSYQKFITSRIFYDIGTKVGYSYIIADSETCRNANDGRGHSVTTGLFIEPTAGIFMISDENLSFGLMVSYSFIQSDFDPVILCLDTNTNIIAAEDNVGGYQLFNVGFGASIFIGKNKLRPSRN